MVYLLLFVVERKRKIRPGVEKGMSPGGYFVQFWGSTEKSWVAGSMTGNPMEGITSCQDLQLVLLRFDPFSAYRIFDC